MVYVQGTVSVGVEVGDREAGLDVNCWNHVFYQWFVLGHRDRLARELGGQEGDGNVKQTPHFS